MPGRVIQGYFVGGQMRAAPGVVHPVVQQKPAPGAPVSAFAAAQRAAPAQHFAPAGHVRPGAVQRHGGNGSFEVDPMRLGLVRAGGSGLPAALLAKMEAAFGADFSAVRVHVGPQASRIGAVAFTTGNDLYFAPGRYQPETTQGQQLIGHELAHVIQQRQGRVRCASAGVAVVQDHAMEAEADRLGMRAAAHRMPVQAKRVPAVTAAAPHVFQRAPGASARSGPPRLARHAGGSALQRMMATGGTGGGSGPPNGVAPLNLPPACTGTLTVNQGTWRMRLWTNFGMAPFSVDDFCAFVGGFGTINGRPRQMALLRELRAAGALFPPILEIVRDGLVLSFDSAQAQQAPVRVAPTITNRQAFGMTNPPHNHVNMVPLWAASAHTPPPQGRDPREHYMSPSRNFLIGDNDGNPVMDPATGQQRMEQGHSNLVMGHNPSASTFINNSGHMNSPGTNRDHNYSPSAYGQIENARASASSGSREPRYDPPSPTRGSWPGYYLSDHPRFLPEYGQLWGSHIRRTCPACQNTSDHLGTQTCSSCGATY